MKRALGWCLAGFAACIACAACGQVVEVLSSPEASGAPERGGRGALDPGAGDSGDGGTTAQAGAPVGEGGGATPEPPLLGLVVDAGDAHGCATRFGILYCWGDNEDGQLGLGDTTPQSAPRRVGLDADWLGVATGIAHTCALKRDGSVWCFGGNELGQLGQGNTRAASAPLLVPLPRKALRLSSEADTACAVLEDGALWCWGRNLEGNIGLNDSHPGAPQLAPIRSGEGNDWLDVGTGDGHTCGVRRTGELFGWGRNTRANLGLGSAEEPQRREATRIGGDSDWTSVVSGQDSSCGIRGGGGLYCWGGNSFGNLGLADMTDRLVPTQVMPGHAWSQVSIDTFHGCAIDSARRLFCWGRGTEGQLGTADEDDRLVPVPVASEVAQAAVGRMFSCLVTVDARVMCTGENDAGQLGLGDHLRRNTFSELTF